MKLTSLSISHFESTIIADSNEGEFKKSVTELLAPLKSKVQYTIMGGGREGNFLSIVHLGCLFEEFGPWATSIK